MVPKLNLKNFAKIFMEIDLEKIKNYRQMFRKESYETLEKYTEKKKES